VRDRDETETLIGHKNWHKPHVFGSRKLFSSLATSAMFMFSKLHDQLASYRQTCVADELFFAVDEHLVYIVKGLNATQIL